MRPGQNKRSRGRNGGGHGGGPHQHRGPRPPHRITTFDSNGPNVKIRGNAYQVFERYLAMAREAASSGDRVAAENLYQHAEHYYRIMQAAGDGQQQGQQRPMTPADNEMSGEMSGEMGGETGNGDGGERTEGRAEGHGGFGGQGGDRGHGGHGNDDGQSHGEAQVQMHTPHPSMAPQPELPIESDDDQRGFHGDRPPGFLGSA